MSAAPAAPNTLAVPEEPGTEPVPAGPGAWAHLGGRLRRTPTLLAGLGLLAGFGATALFAIQRYGAGRNQPPVNPTWTTIIGLPPGPSWAHPLGTDSGLGIDVLSGLLRATPNDLALVGTILLLAATAGLLIGGWAGLAGGWADVVALGAADLLVGVPPFFLVIVLYLGIGPLLPTVDALPVFALLFAFVLWPYYARPVRAVAQRSAGSPYVESARAAGAGLDRLLFRHVLPNSIYPVLAQLPIDVFNIFFVLSVFPFIGCFGGAGAFSPVSITPSPLYPEWGSMLGFGACFGWSLLPSLDAWWSYAFPAAVIILFGLMVVLICDGLERHLGVGGPR